MTDWSDAADGETGRIADEVGVRATDVRCTEDVRHLRGVDLLVSACQDEHGRSVGGEDE